MPKDVRVFDVLNGHRVERTVTIDPAYKVRFLGYPTTIKYNVAGVEYSYGDIADLVAGEYSYRAYVPDSLNGDKFEEVQSTFVLSGGDMSLEQALQPLQITLKVKVKDTGNDIYLKDAIIYVDGVRRGYSDNVNYVDVTVPIGRRVISATKDGLQGAVTGLITEADHNRTQDILMSASTDLSKGYIIFKSDPPGASITINGQPNPDGNLTPDDVSNVPSGLVNFKLEKAGFNAYESSVNVPEGGGAYVVAKLEPIPTTATATFSSNTSGVSLYIDGEFKGSLPVTLVLSPGIYKYSATKTGYTPKEATQFSVVAGGTYPIYVEMNPVQYPPRGQFIKFVCQGYDKYQELHDGSGGTTLEFVEKNAQFCNFPQSKTVVFTSNASGTFKVYNSFNVLVGSGTFVKGDALKFQKDTPASINLPYGVYTVRVEPTAEQSLYYDTNSSPLNVLADTSSQDLYLPMKSYSRRVGNLVLDFKCTEQKVSVNGDTNGFGGIIEGGNAGTFQAYAQIKEYISGTGNTFGTMKVSLPEVGYYSGEFNFRPSNPYVTTGSVNPFNANVRNIKYLWSNTTISHRTGSGQSEMYRVRASEFQFKVEGWFFDDGVCYITVNVPVEYWVLDG